ELDPRELLLAGVLDRVRPIARPLFLDDLVLDPLLVESLLDSPARVGRELHPDVLAAMQLDCHQPPPFGRISVTPSRTVSITDVTRESDLHSPLKPLTARVLPSSSASRRTRRLHTGLSPATKPRSVQRGSSPWE